MKTADFIFKDFLRKLVALIFAVVIYWQAGGFAKKTEARDVKVEEKVQINVSEVSRTAMEFPVGIIDDGSGRRVGFAPGVEPRVKATLRGESLSDVQSGVDLRFYVDPPSELKPGEYTLPVLCNIRRSGLSVISVTPEKIRVSIGENPVKKP